MTPLLSYLRYLLFPFSLLYGLIIFIRNKLYDWGILKSVKFHFPVISVGNLSVGGTGKTPHIEYLIRNFAAHYKLAVLSRGYKRKTSGYRLVKPMSTADETGDEASLIKSKYPFVNVAVAEERVYGIPQLLGDAPETQVLLLDDAFQHRSVEPAINILLTRFNKPYTRDFILPAGSLREFRSSAKRADFIIVSKCPTDLTNEQRKALQAEIKPDKNQLLLFSYLKYGLPYNIINGADKLDLSAPDAIYLFTGIAQLDELMEYLKSKTKEVFNMEFPDHHNFDAYDMANIRTAYTNIERKNKVLLTTEKDVVRLIPHKKWIAENKLPIYVLPVQVEFFEKDKALLHRELSSYFEKVLNTNE